MLRQRTVNLTQINFVSGRGDPLVSAAEVVALGPQTPEPDISVSPVSVDFGSIVIGTTSDEVVTIANTGSETLTLSSWSTTNGVFTIVNPLVPFDVLAGGIQDVTVRFSPTIESTEVGDLEITSNDPDEGLVIIPLTGDGEVGCSTLQIWDPVAGECIDLFTDITDTLGVGDISHRHFGIAVVDINNDGWVDLLYPNGIGNPIVESSPSGTCPDLSGGTPAFDPANENVLYLNNGDGTFSMDIASIVGLNDYWNAMRHVWADYDNDGLRDLISHNFLKSPLYHAISGPDPLLLRRCERNQ